MIVYLDYEIRSELNLKQTGLYRYASHPSTQITLAAYAVDDEKTDIWEARHGPLPATLRQFMEDKSIKFCSWNAQFERTITHEKLGIWIPYNRWIDPMIWARHLSLPGDLDFCCEILGLPDTVAKMKEGHRLIDKFSRPVSMGGIDLFGASGPRFLDWTTDPADWDLFCQYCCHDVEAERAILKLLRATPLPESEQRTWELDQKINDRGLPADRELAANALALAEQEYEELAAQQQTITGLDNPNSTAQLLPWLRDRGYAFGALGKEFVTAALNTDALAPDARLALELRQKLAKTSYKKFVAIKDRMSEDDRLRGQFAFMGAARTARWSGYGFQFHNLPRPDKTLTKNMEEIREFIRRRQYEALKEKYGSAIQAVTGAIRSVFVAKPGKRLVVCDLSAIENRVLGWVAGCDAILNVFREGRDPYLDFGTKMFHKPHDQITKDERQVAKPPVLGCGYGLGVGEEKRNGAGDLYHTGLWGYADKMGISLTAQQREDAVRVFREEYSEVVALWDSLEDAARRVISRGGKVQVGPVVLDRKKRKDGSIILRIGLPSGRFLHYINARLVGDRGRKEIMYDGIGHGVGVGDAGPKWGSVKTYGGKLTENVVQAIARDILVYGMHLADNAGFMLVGHVHDELICEEDQDGWLGLDDLRACMSATPPWAPGLPLDAAGYEGRFYRKD